MFERKLKSPALLFSIFLMLGATVYGQSINDDLNPATKPAKPKTETKNSVKKTEKSTKKVSRQPTQKSGKSNSPAIKSNRSPERSSENYAVPSETPDQIINRFMNFQQSSGVTERDWKSVVAQTTKTLQENPNHSTAKAQSLIAQGQIAYNDRSYPAAIAYFKSALQILPTSSLPKYSLGQVYLANGQAKAAEQAFKEAIDKNEDFALAYKGMGDALVAQGENKKATKYFKKATETSVRKGSMP